MSPGLSDPGVSTKLDQRCGWVDRTSPVPSSSWNPVPGGRRILPGTHSQTGSTGRGLRPDTGCRAAYRPQFQRLDSVCC